MLFGASMASHTSIIGPDVGIGESLLLANTAQKVHMLCSSAWQFSRSVLLP